MKLKRLKATDFVGLPEADIEFQRPVTLFAGKNNQGKSSIKDAIEFALTGKARAMSKFNEAKNLSRNGDGMLVDLDIIDKESGEIETKRRTAKTQGGAYANPLLHYCLNPESFIRLDSKVRGKLLSDALGGGLDDLVKEAISEYIGQIDNDLVAEIKSSGVDLFDVDALKKKVVELRRQYKRDKQESERLCPLLVDYKIEKDFDAKATEKQVKELGERISKGGEYIAAVKQNQLIKAELIDIDKAIEAEKAKIKKVPDLDGGINPDQVRMVSVYSSIIDEILQSKKSGECNCPICHTSKTIKFYKERNKEFENWLGDYADKLKERDRIATDNECAKNEMRRLENRRKELNQKFVKVDYKEGSEDLLKNLTEQRDKLQANVANYGRYEEAVRQYEQAKNKTIRLDELIAECDRIDDALKDGGPVKSAIAAGGRELPINTKLLELWDMLDLVWSDTGEIALRDIPIEYASASEQYRAGCVMALALAEVSGVGIAALDGFEVLVSDNANAFMTAVEDCRIDNVLVFASTDKDYSNVNIPEWLDVFKVEKGKVTKFT